LDWFLARHAEDHHTAQTPARATKRRAAGLKTNQSRDAMVVRQ